MGEIMKKKKRIWRRGKHIKKAVAKNEFCRQQDTFQMMPRLKWWQCWQWWSAGWWLMGTGDEDNNNNDNAMMLTMTIDKTWEGKCAFPPGCELLRNEDKARPLHQPAPLSPLSPQFPLAPSPLFIHCRGQWSLHHHFYHNLHCSLGHQWRQRWLITIVIVKSPTVIGI